MRSYADAHCDTLTKLADAGEHLWQNKGHLDLMRLCRYKTAVQVFAIWLNKMYYQNATQKTLSYLTYFERELAKNQDLIALVKNYDDILQNKKQGKCSAILAIEGGEALEGQISTLQMYYEKGVRMMTLTWNYPNALGDGVDGFGGLTLFGKSVVKEMYDIGIVVDVSHLAEKGFYDVADFGLPFIASHSNARQICSHRRNLTKQQLKIVKENDGFVGVNFYADFLTDNGKATIDDVLRHIWYLLDMAGECHVGFGSDFDGITKMPQNLNGVEDMAILLEILEKEFGKELTEKIAEQNFLAMLQRVWK